MTATLGTITEHVWRFAGYLHTPEEIDRARLEYLDALAWPMRPDPVPHVRDPNRPPTDDDDPGTLTIPVPPLLAPFALPGFELALGSLKALPPIPAGSAKASPQLPDRPPPIANLSADGSGIPSLPRNRQIEVSYEPGGDQQIAEYLQLNQLSDNDVLLNGSLEGWSIDWTLPTTQEVDHLVALADGAIPPAASGVIVADPNELVSMVGSGQLQGASSTVEPGLYVNGVLASEKPQMPPRPADQAESEVAPDPATGPVHSVVTGPTGSPHIATGGNTESNLVGLYDGNEATGSLIVMGNVVKSDAIFQVNVLLDNDATAGLASDVAQPSPDNVLTNIADLSENLPTFAAAGAGATPNWKVHVVDGDFIDVKSAHQYNLADDNDTVVTYTANHTYKINTGDNAQNNALTEIHDIGLYDVIVVMGSMHSYNWIFQKNILIDSDQVEVRFGEELGDESRGSPTANYTASTNDNVLWNDASIKHYGEDDYQSVPSSELDLVAALAAGETSLSAKPWGLQGAADGTLDVLFVKGNYFDLNFLFQTNILRDVDAVGLDASLGDRVPTISTGSNTLVNTAQIIDVGTLTTSQYANGSVYSESVLVQTNIVADANEVEVHDTTTLPPELVAFIDTTVHQSEEVNTVTSTKSWSHDDVIGSIFQ